MGMFRLVLAVLGLCAVVRGQGQPPAEFFNGGTTAVEAHPGAGSGFTWSEFAGRRHGEQARYDLGDDDRVLLHNGSFVHEVTDFRIPGRKLDLLWRRTYRTDSAENGPFGVGWQFNYNQYIVSGNPQVGQQNTIIALNDGIGRGFAFKRYGGGWLGPENVSATLVVDPDGSYRLTETEGTVRTFFAPTATTVGRHARVLLTLRPQPEANCDRSGTEQADVVQVLADEAARRDRGLGYGKTLDSPTGPQPGTTYSSAMPSRFSSASSRDVSRGALCCISSSAWLCR